MSRERNRGADAFERFYGELYGDRWPALRRALFAEPGYEAISGIVGEYYVDRGSSAAARALGVRPGERVLDLCAAPGGKSLMLAVALCGSGTLVCNERSSSRRARLHRVLDHHLTPALRGPVTVTGHDATRWGVYEPSSYDRVLADVPCSSERHVAASASALAQWSPSRTKRLAQQAYAIACAAADALVPGGTMVYSTCALSPAENDGVISRLLRRGGVAIAATPAGAGAPTEHGVMIAPDLHGAGPIYYAVLGKPAA